MGNSLRRWYILTEIPWGNTLYLDKKSLFMRKRLRIARRGLYSVLVVYCYYYPSPAGAIEQERKAFMAGEGFILKVHPEEQGVR